MNEEISCCFLHRYFSFFCIHRNDDDRHHHQTEKSNKKYNQRSWLCPLKKSKMRNANEKKFSTVEVSERRRGKRQQKTKTYKEEKKIIIQHDHNRHYRHQSVVVFSLFLFHF